MGLAELLPILLGAAWLLPLASFVLIVFVGPRMGKHGVLAGDVATGAIVGSLALSLVALALWLVKIGPRPAGGATHHASVPSSDAQSHASNLLPSGRSHFVHLVTDETGGDHAPTESGDHVPSSAHAADAQHPSQTPTVFTGDWYTLGQFGRLKLAVSYYIDALTVAMFAMVTMIASCIHFYAKGYMHDELHDITDHEVTLADGHHLHRPGRYHRFFQYLSLFCFSMLGLVVAGNIAMVFVFWELVGICSYFLIGFYHERKSASNAANKAFIVNRVGDFGMIVGMMALWSSLGTFAFGNSGMFGQVRPEADEFAIRAADGMVLDAAGERIAQITNEELASRLLGPDFERQWVEDHSAAVARVREVQAAQYTPGRRELVADAMAAVATRTREELPDWRTRFGYGLLLIGGLGIFCGCVGKSAQFPLHVWLPDAMEGPTPVSALVHSATMVAAGVYLVGRFYPMFSPDVLTVIAVVGTITLLIAASIALVAVDIKRVLAYSTVSQLGYMMLALGLGAWFAGLFHLITHAFFKSLLFMCSGSVIHACHTNDMTKMGGLRRKMPWTAYTMLVGCLAIIGAVGFSGFYSKDAIVAQALSFRASNPALGSVFAAAAVGGAALTAFYMFRLWYMTFAGVPRDHHVAEHVHESPKLMYVPLVILSVFAVGVGWTLPWGLSVENMLEQARFPGEVGAARNFAVNYPTEHASHQFHGLATMVATATAVAGLLLATAFYFWRLADPAEVRNQFRGIYRWLWNKWYFDELYDVVFVRPTHAVAALVAYIDRSWIDGLIHWVAGATKALSRLDDLVDRYFVDGLVNLSAEWTYSAARSLRRVQSGRLRQYVLLIVVATVALAVLINFAVAR